jgi:hypothetical protein
MESQIKIILGTEIKQTQRLVCQEVLKEFFLMSKVGSGYELGSGVNDIFDTDTKKVGIAS